tara:strand:- start:1207 stop:2043 length:837 start_codon:yes stop_codon:yes gene_type:complete
MFIKCWETKTMLLRDLNDKNIILEIFDLSWNVFWLLNDSNNFKLLEFVVKLCIEHVSYHKRLELYLLCWKTILNETECGEKGESHSTLCYSFLLKSIKETRPSEELSTIKDLAVIMTTMTTNNTKDRSDGSDGSDGSGGNGGNDGNDRNDGDDRSDRSDRNDNENENEKIQKENNILQMIVNETIVSKNKILKKGKSKKKEKSSKPLNQRLNLLKVIGEIDDDMNITVDQLNALFDAYGSHQNVMIFFRDLLSSKAIGKKCLKHEERDDAKEKRNFFI